jgi:hypothetical protein
MSDVSQEDQGEQLVVVAISGIPEYAHMAKNWLESNGIKVALDGDVTATDVYTGSTGVRLLIRQADVEKARRLLRLPPQTDKCDPGVNVFRALLPLSRGGLIGLALWTIFSILTQKDLGTFLAVGLVCFFGSAFLQAAIQGFIAAMRSS